MKAIIHNRVCGDYLETAPVGLGFFDRELCYLRVNDALAVINGLPASEHLGRSLAEAGLPRLSRPRSTKPSDKGQSQEEDRASSQPDEGRQVEGGGAADAEDVDGLLREGSPDVPQALEDVLVRHGLGLSQQVRDDAAELRGINVAERRTVATETGGGNAPAGGQVAPTLGKRRVSDRAATGPQRNLIGCSAAVDRL